jgi:hypothetical protein
MHTLFIVASNCSIFLGYIYIYLFIYLYGYGKGKAIPLQAWTGPEGSGKLRLPDFKRVFT